MKIFTIVITALLATAAPAIVEACNPIQIPITFIGAASGSFTQYFPADSSLHIISNYHILFCTSPHSLIKKISDMISPVYSKPPQRLQNPSSTWLHLRFLWCWWQRYRCYRTGYHRCRASTSDSECEVLLYLGQQNRSCASSPAVDLHGGWESLKSWEICMLLSISGFKAVVY